MANVQRFWPSQKVSNWLSTDAGISWSGSTANGLGTYSSSSEIVAESTATYDGTTLTLTTSGGGLKMDGLNSSDANTLDDYEEGVFTITATCGTSGTITVDTDYDQASYVKVGKIVYIQGYIGLSAVSSPSGTLQIPLPFTTSHTGMPELSDYSVNASQIRDAGTNIAGGTYGLTVPNTAVMRYVGGGGQTAHIDTIAGYIDAASTFWIGGTYRADA